MSISVIKSDIVKLQNIQTELKRLSGEIKKLKTEKLRLENKLIEWLERNENAGVTIEDTTVLAEVKKRRGRKGRIEKEEAALNILRETGIVDANSTLERLLTSMRGEEHLVKGIKIERSRRI